MNGMNDTKQIFCLSAVLLYTITILQITLLLLDSVCNVGIQIDTSQMTFVSESHLYIVFSFVLLIILC